MTLAVVPPVAPMLARLARELPLGEHLYEPKWDGFRCLAFRDGEEVDLRSRHDRPLARYFPEIVEALRDVRPDAFALDGELVVATASGFDFAALMSRLHPAPSRVRRLRDETPACFVAFDVLAVGGSDLRDTPFAVRRTRLQELLERPAPPLFITPITSDPAVAREWLERFQGAGIDGVVAKHRALRYEPGKRAMVKVKRERTADCVVAGFRWLEARRALGSLILGLYDDSGALRHVGVVSALSEGRRAEFAERLASLVTPIEQHPWREGFGLERSPLGRLKGAAGRWVPGMEQDWIPVRPELVCEVRYDQIDGGRFRHPARFVRWRPDREARSCTFDQLRVDAGQVANMLPLTGAGPMS